MTEPSSDLVVAAAAESVRDNASNLSLQWGLRPATVSSFDDDTSVAKLIIDGDTNAVSAISLVGVLLPGERVMTLTVPPSGLYVTAHIGGSFAGPPYQARQTLSSSASTVTFSSIPTALRRIEIHYTARGSAAVQTQQLRFRVNSNSGAVYFSEFKLGLNNTVFAFSSASTTSGVCGLLTGASASSTIYGSGDMVLVGWDSPHSNGLGYQFRAEALGSTVADYNAYSGGGIYSAVGPYTSLTFLPNSGGNFDAGTDFQLTGWRS